jgi:hypothetical protein
VIGSISGMLGIGGGVLIVPALIWLCGFEDRKAMGTSIAILIPPIGLPAAIKAYQQEAVNLTAAFWIAGAFMVGAYASRYVVDVMPVTWIRFLFGLMMVFVALRFLVQSDSEVHSAAAGLVGVVLAWLAYFGLKTLGRKHLPPPSISAHIQEQHQKRPQDIDFQI